MNLPRHLKLFSRNALLLGLGSLLSAKPGEGGAAEWTRTRWKPTGRDAVLFYVVIGTPPEKGLRLRNASQLPGPVEITIHRKADDPKWFMGFLEDPIGHTIDGVFGAGAKKVRSAQTITVVKGRFEDPRSLDYLRDTVDVVTAVSQNDAIAILDLQQIRWYTPEYWRELFVAQTDFEIRRHVALTVTDDARYHPGLWMHTRGMIKFGRPELQIRHVPGQLGKDSAVLQPAADVLNAVARYLALGAVVGDGETMAFPGHKTVVAFKAYPDDSGAEGHFQNSALQIVDFDRDSKRLSDTLDRHLAEAAALNRAATAKQ